MRPFLAIGLVAIFLSAGCNGPKETCEGSFNSYFSALEGHDWDAMYELLTPKFKKKVRSPEVFARYIATDWAPSKDFSKQIQNIAPSGSVCIVNGAMSYTVKIRGKEPERIEDEYFSWTFRLERDGRWYIELPGEEKLQGY